MTATTFAAVPIGCSLSLPDFDAVDTAPLGALPAFIGTVDVLKAKALARLVGTPPAACSCAPPDDADRYVTVAQVAQRLGFTEQYVYEAIRTGDLPAIEIGPKRYKRVAQADFRAWVASKKLDTPEYLTYSGVGGRRRGATIAEEARRHAKRARGTSGRGAQQRGAVGTRRTRHTRVSCPVDAAPGTAVAEARTWQEELTDGLH